MTDTSKEAVEDLIAEIEGAFTCRCETGYTDRGLHAPDCQGYMLPGTTDTLRALLAEREFLLAENKLLKDSVMLRASLETEWADKRDEFTDQIEAAHPFREPKDFERYNLAMQLVGNRRSKLELVKLVAWLLTFRSSQPKYSEEWMPDTIETPVFSRVDEPCGGDWSVELPTTAAKGGGA